MNIFVGVFLVAHALVHVLYFIRPDDEKYPMTAGKSWLLKRGMSLGTVRAIVGVLAGSALVGFVLFALSFWEFLVPGEWFAALGIVSALLSLVLIAVTWDKQLFVGAAINVAIIAWVLT